MEISICSLATISALGSSKDAVRANGDRETRLSKISVGGRDWWAGRLPQILRDEILEELKMYNEHDESVLFAIWVSRKALAEAGWDPGMHIGINIGSSRGATGLWEAYHSKLLKEGRVGSHASPMTTLGNIASWVAHDLGTRGPVISHSITCSTALHAILNGCIWIRSGMVDGFLAGGAEAPLTMFTLKQMEALKIYSREDGPYPCRAMDLTKRSNTMVLAEGAGVVALQGGLHREALAVISGIGYATEPLQHAVSLSAEADCLRNAMEMALGSLSPSEVDVIVLHAPGTRKGDQAEVRAVEKVFGSTLPALTTNKWKVGHALGASGILSLGLAVEMLQEQCFVGLPYLKATKTPNKISRVLVNAVGFGGNAVSILVERPPAHPLAATPEVAG